MGISSSKKEKQKKPKTIKSTKKKVKENHRSKANKMDLHQETKVSSFKGTSGNVDVEVTKGATIPSSQDNENVENEKRQRDISIQQEPSHDVEHKDIGDVKIPLPREPIDGNMEHVEPQNVENKEIEVNIPLPDEPINENVENEKIELNFPLPDGPIDENMEKKEMEANISLPDKSIDENVESEVIGKVIIPLKQEATAENGIKEEAKPAPPIELANENVGDDEIQAAAALPPEDNYQWKSKLHEYLESLGVKTPTYNTTPSKLGFSTVIILEIDCTEYHEREQDAEQAAANIALKILKQEGQDISNKENHQTPQPSPQHVTGASRKSNKSILQERAQKKWGCIPGYTSVTAEKGRFISTVKISDDYTFKSFYTHVRKRDAEEDAAQVAISELFNDDEEDYQTISVHESKNIDINKIKQSPKNFLQEYLQKCGKLLASYSTVPSTNRNGFDCTVDYDGKQYTGQGGNKKGAEQAAASEVLKDLLKIDFDDLMASAPGQQ